MAVAQSSSGGVAIRYVLPVLWMMSHLVVVGHMASGVAIPGWSLMSVNALFLIMSKMSLPKRSGPYWSNPPFLIF